MEQQIHHTQVVFKDRWVADPDNGMVKRSERIMKRSSVDRIVFRDGRVFEIHEDGSFVVPDDVAQFYLRMPDWHEGASPFAPDEPTPTPETLAPRTVKAPIVISPKVQRTA